MGRILLYSALTAALLVAMNLYVARHPIFARKVGRVDANYAQLSDSASECSRSEL
jgi:hypothetical protein